MMFVHHCERCDRDQLIFPSMFTGATQGEQGLEVSFTCWCGAEQVHTQRPAGADRAGHELAA